MEIPGLFRKMGRAERYRNVADTVFRLPPGFTSSFNVRSTQTMILVHDYRSTGTFHLPWGLTVWLPS